MALNFSHRRLFTEDKLVAPSRIANGYLVDDCFDHGRDQDGMHGGQESVSNDIVDLLPSDPFGMDISSTFTAISGWLEDLQADYGGYSANDAVAGTSDGDYGFYAELNFIWNNTMKFQAFPVNWGFGQQLNVNDSCSSGCLVRKKAEDASFIDDGFVPACNVDDILRLTNESKDFQNEEFQTVSEVSLDGDATAPHEAFNYALGYLGVRDLLAVEAVCKSLHLLVQKETLFWRSIHIHQPLNEKINDDILLELTDRAQGKLQLLSLVDCSKITDDGLKRVLERNPTLTKLYVPGCTRLSIEGIMTSLKEFTQGVKHLRIGRLYGVTQKHFEELKLLLGADNSMQQDARKPRFYKSGNLYMSCDDDCAIDIEICPMCQNPRLVYDCPAEGCLGKKNEHLCKACTLCIARCALCGRCINDSEYEETFCLDLLCSACGCFELPEEPRHKDLDSSPPALSDPSGNVGVHG